MTEGSHLFVGSIPEFYDSGLGPVMFEGYAAWIARRAAEASPGRVLETAAGTGIVTKRLLDALAPSSRLVATDLNPPMLAVAQRKCESDARVSFQAADATALPFEDGAFDAMVCQFGVMFYPDKAKSYREARRVLAPGGSYFFSVWDSREHNAFARIVSGVLERSFAFDPPPFLGVPFGYFAIDPIKTAVLEAGFAGLRVDVVKLQAPILNFRAFAEGLTRGSPLADQITSRGLDIAKVVDAAEFELRREFGATGHADLQAIFFEARRD
jgi:SAM-dependent methyltransferase